jgi:tetratricopeptide (TPR) repeat protein
LKYASGKPTAAVVTELEKARVLADSQMDLQLRAVVYASLTYNALYLPPPGGFQTARDAARAYVNRSENLPSADVWFNLACAYGQQYAMEKDAGGGDDALKQLRDESLKALEQAIALQPQLRDRARDMVEGKAGEDNDLVAISQDDDFAKFRCGLRNRN